MENPALELFLLASHPYVQGLLVLIGLFLAYRLGLFLGRSRRARVATEGSRRALAGRVAEQWAPYLDDFPGLPQEARFLGAPIDYVVFRGLGSGEIDEIVFVEVKSGRGTLTAVERSLRDCVAEGRIAWVEHRVDAPR